MTVDLVTIGIDFDTSGLEKGDRAMARAEGSANKLAGTVGKVGPQGSRAFNEYAQAAAVAERQTRVLSDTTATFLRIAGAGFAALGVGQLIAMTDEYTKYTAQLRLATSSNTEYANSLATVRRLAREGQADLVATGTLYARIANGTRELGLSQQKVGQITEAVTLGLRVSGATAAESASAMLQLSQAFASGQLRGEEFNAVNEAAPRLMKALADGIGVPVGALREMATEGRITSQIMAEALPKALGELRKEAEQVRTIGGAFTLLKNNLVEFVGTQAQASGSAAALAKSIELVADNLNVLAAAGIGFASAKIAETLAAIGVATVNNVGKTMEYAGALTAQRAAAIASAEAEIAAAAAQAQKLTATQAAIVISREDAVAKLNSANAAMAQASAQIAAARSAGALSFALATMREGERALTAAMQARSVAMAELAILGQQQARVSAQITAATAAQTAAQGALTSATAAGGAAAGLATRALGLLGGPIGAVTTLLGLGVTAWMLWGSASESQEAKATAAVEKSTQEIVGDLERQIAKLKERNALAAAGMGDAAKQGGEAAAKLASLQRQIEDLQNGRGPAEILPEAARLDLLQKLTMQYGQLAGAMTRAKEEQAKLDSQGKTASDVIEIRQRLAGVNKQYIEDLNKLQAALRAGAITEAEYVSLVSELATQTWERAKAGKDAAAAGKQLNQEQEAQNRLLAELNGLSGSFFEDWTNLNKLYAANKISLEQLIAAQAKLLEQQPAMKQQAKEEEDARKAADDAIRRAAQSSNRYVDELLRQQEALQQDIEKQREHNASIGLGVVALADLQAAKLEEAAASLERQATVREELAGDTALAEMYRQQARQLRELAQLKRTGAAKEAAFDEAKKQADEFKRQQEDLWRSIDRTAQEVWTNVFDGGSNAFKRLGQTLKAAVLDLLYQMTVRPFVVNVIANVTGQGGNVGNIMSMLGGGGGATSWGGLLDMGGSFLGGGMFDGAGLFGGIGTSLFGSAAAYASAVPGLTMAGAGSQAAMLAAQTGAFGAAGLSATASAGAGAAGAGAAGGLAGTAAAAIPYIGWAIAIGSMLYSIFGGQGGGPKSEGFFNPYNSDRYFTSNSGQVNSASRQAAQTLQQQYNAITKAFGVSDNLMFGLGFSTDPEGDAPTMLHIGGGRNGSTQFDLTRGDVGRSEEDLQRAITEMGGRAILLGLQQSGLHGEIGAYLRGLGDIASLAADKVSEALARVEKAGNERAQLEEAIFQLTATELDKLNRQRRLEREALDSSNRALYDYYVQLQGLVGKLQEANVNVAAARGILVDAYQREKSELESTIEQHRAYARSLREFRDSLLVGSLSPLSGSASLLLTQASFRRMAAGAAGGDDTAVQGLSQSATAYLESALRMARTSEEYRQIFNEVRRIVGATADTQDGIATQEQKHLEELQKQLTAMGVINETILSVGDAITLYLEAINQQGAAQNALNKAMFDYQVAKDNEAKAAAAAAAQAAAEAAAAAASSPEEIERFVSWVAIAQGLKTDPSKRIGSVAHIGEDGGGDTSGDAGVNGSATADSVSASNAAAGIDGAGFAIGTDYVPKDMWAFIHKGERITPKRFNPAAGGLDSSGGQAVVGAIERLRLDMRNENAAIVLQINRLFKLHQDWDRNGQPEVREV